MSVSGTSRAKKILVVDADVRSSERLASLLREDGFEVEVARDALSALARLGTSHPFDTLITELDIPGGEVAEVAGSARARCAGLRVIVVTRYANALGARDLGGAAPRLLPKPLDYGRLLELLSGESPSERASGMHATLSRA